MDRFSPPRRIQSIRRHAAYAYQITRENRKPSPSKRKSNLGTATDAAIRRSIIEILSATEEEADLAANDLAEVMDSTFFPKSALTKPQYTPKRYAGTGYPSKCVTVVPQERTPGQASSSPSRQRRKPLAIMDKLRRHNPQRSITSTSPRKPSVDDDLPTMHRYLKRLSKAVRKRNSVVSPQVSPRKHSRTPSCLSNLKPNLCFSPSKRSDTYEDHLAPTVQTPMLDATFEQIIHAKHDLGAPKIDSAHHAYIDDSFRDSAYWSTKASEDSTFPAQYGVDTNKYAHVSPRKKSASKQGQLLPAIQFKHDSSLSNAPAHTLPVIQRPPLLHSTSAPILKNAPLPRPRLQTALSSPLTPTTLRGTPSRPRFDHYLSTASIFTEGSMTASPTTSKPPSPLRERPYLDLNQLHKRTLSDGSVTGEIKIFLDETESSDEEGEDILLKPRALKVKSIKPPAQVKKEQVKLEESHAREVRGATKAKEEMTPDELAADALKRLNRQTMSTGHMSLANPLFRKVLQTEEEDIFTSPPSNPQQPTLLTAKTFKPPIHLRKGFPDVAYAPPSSVPGQKWYDEFATAQSRDPVWAGRYVRGRDYDVGLVRLCEDVNFSQGAVAKRIMRGRVSADDFEGRFGTPFEEACGRARIAREGAERMRRDVESIRKA